MKILIVFFSRTGRTRKAAEKLAVLMGADLDELHENKTDRSGLVGYMKSGRDALQKRLSDLLPLAHDPAQYDLVVLGSPVWAFTLCPAMRTFLTASGNSIKKAAFLSTHGGGGPARSYAEAERLIGKPLVGTLALLDRAIDRDEVHDQLAAFAGKIANRE